MDPDELDYIIPANDDAIRSIRLLCQLVADAAIQGAQERAARAAAEPEPQPEVEAAEAAGPAFDESASDELVAALAGGGVVSFEPDFDEDELLPEPRVVGTPPGEASEEPATAPTEATAGDDSQASSTATES